LLKLSILERNWISNGCGLKFVVGEILEGSGARAEPITVRFGVRIDMGKIVNCAGLFLVGALALSMTSCSPPTAAPAVSTGGTTTSPSQSSPPAASQQIPEPSLSPSERFTKSVMVPKDLDLSGLVMTDEIKSHFPDGGKGALALMQQYLKEANSIPELNKGSHITSAADYPLLDKLQPLMTEGAFNSLKEDYVQPSGTAMIHSYVNDGSGFNSLVLGKVHPDDNGPVWQWGNEKASARYATGDAGSEGVIVKIPVRFSFNTSDKGTVSLYASREYAMVHGSAGWLLAGITWSAADTRSSQDSPQLLEAVSPIDGL